MPAKGTIRKNTLLPVAVKPTGERDPDISSLLIVLDHFHPIGREAIRFIKQHIIACTVRKKKFILKTGTFCHYIYFIKKGAVRGFIKEGNKDITTWITVENEMVTSISSLDIQLPSIENMQAIEDCELLALSYTDLQELYLRSPEINIVVRKLLQTYYGDAEKRAFIARLTKADHRYQYFQEKHAGLINRVPLKYIASFLGMTLETLSRVRKKASQH